MNQAVIQILSSFSLSRIAQANLLQPSRALAPVQQLVALPNGDSAEQSYELGLTYHRAGQLSAAIQAYQNAIRLNPEFDAAYINLGLALIQQNQFAAAAAAFQQALALPDRPEDPASIHAIAHYNLAVILERQGDSTAALAEVEQALAIAPQFQLAQQFRQRLQSPPEP